MSSDYGICNHRGCDFKGSGLLIHSLDHMEAQTFRCPVTHCAKSYGRRSDVKRHVDAVHLDTVHECPYFGCSYTTFTKDVVRRHVRSDHSGIRWSCRHCELAFGGLLNVRGHVVNVHRIKAVSAADYRKVFVKDIQGKHGKCSGSDVADISSSTLAPVIHQNSPVVYQNNPVVYQKQSATNIVTAGPSDFTVPVMPLDYTNMDFGSWDDPTYRALVQEFTDDVSFEPSHESAADGSSSFVAPDSASQDVTTDFSAWMDQTYVSDDSFGSSRPAGSAETFTFDAYASQEQSYMPDDSFVTYTPLEHSYTPKDSFDTCDPMEHVYAPNDSFDTYTPLEHNYTPNDSFDACVPEEQFYMPKDSLDLPHPANPSGDMAFGDNTWFDQSSTTDNLFDFPDPTMPSNSFPGADFTS